MPTPSTRFADKANLKTLFAGLKAKYEPKDATIVKDASYVHTDTNYSSTDKSKLDGITAITNSELDELLQ
jgi:hypothetical protein